MIYPQNTKVVPRRKSIGCSFYTDQNWLHAQESQQPYLYIARQLSRPEIRKATRYPEELTENEIGYALSYNKNDITGNYYLESDFILYVNNMTFAQFIKTHKE